ncbi:MAG: SCP2 sterol-binding domain-containing protein [Solirubrobacteraceae bacterium]|nr:SCP2 sterol-binding domain-containing protein [Solirubrobacteraceae bacterium]
MPYFKDGAEVEQYLGGVFRKAADTPEGEKLAAADIDLQVYYSDPDAKVLIKMRQPKLEVVDGGENEDADVKLYMPSDIGDKFWRGEYNLAVGLAKGQVKAKGPVAKILKLVPLTKPLFPMYREMVAEKDGAAA